MPQFQIEVYPLPEGTVCEKDVPLVMRDGVRIATNIYRPDKPGKFPVIMSFSPYGKDVPPQEYGKVLQGMADNGQSIGKIRISQSTPFEAPDPAFWVAHDYTVIHVDVRGFGKSGGKREGTLRSWSEAEIQDYYEIIEWAGQQEWSNGNVGLSGVSYLAMSQFHAASICPPHLKAINPWEGVSDAYRDTCFPGGIPESNFHVYWETRYLERKFNEAAVTEFLDPVKNQSLLETAPQLEKITVPTLICATWSDQGLHSRGGFEAYRRISSRDKWLYTHGRRKWEEYYISEGLDYQKRFFDCFLKGNDNGFRETPRVRLEVRESLDKYRVRPENDWPIANTEYKKLYLNSGTCGLDVHEVKQEGLARYECEEGRAVFNTTFDEDTEISGLMKLKLWVSAEAADDMDLFISIEKVDKKGRKVDFLSMNGYSRGMAARGWLRVSQREIDHELSTPQHPVLRHRGEKKIEPGEVVDVEIEILPSSTLFREGETLRLVIQGKDIIDHPMIKYTRLINLGIHSIHTGGKCDSHLLVPVIPR